MTRFAKAIGSLAAVATLLTQTAAFGAEKAAKKAAGAPAPVSAAPRPTTEATTVKLWPGKPPGETTDIGAERVDTQGDVVKNITNVSEPILKVYPAPKGTANGLAILIAPGGGYKNLAWDHEGEQIAGWANSIGATACILKYRVPRRPGTSDDQPPLGALQDAQRAMGIIRSKADEWHIDAHKVGMVGFSAGGHLCAWTSTNFDKRSYDAIDDADKLSSRPDFSLLIYPGGTIEKDSITLRPQIKVSADTPPSFLVMAHNDPVNSDNCIALYMAMKKAGVSAEMHIYATGGHGFGMRPNARPAATWPERAVEWMKAIKVLD